MTQPNQRAHRNLYILNLPLDATTQEFDTLFSAHGTVEHAVILATLDHLARRRGFILMRADAEARRAIESLNGYSWRNYRIEVSFAIVQRSGAPFSQHTVGGVGQVGHQDVRHQDVALPKHTTVQSLDNIATDLPNRVGEIHPHACQHEAQHRAHGWVLVLSGLDTSVASSATMVGALTEPFGHVVGMEVCEPDEVEHAGARGMVVYCCDSSAWLAQVSLNGLVVGSRRIRASLTNPSEPRPPALHAHPTNDVVLNERPNFPRPIGDERQKASMRSPR